MCTQVHDQETKGSFRRLNQSTQPITLRPFITGVLAEHTALHGALANEACDALRHDIVYLAGDGATIQGAASKPGMQGCHRAVLL